MAQKYDTIYKDETLCLSKGNDGYWLYDQTRGMNLSMRAKSETEAYTDALHYYQERLTKVEKAYQDLKGHVDAFCSIVSDEEE